MKNTIDSMAVDMASVTAMSTAIAVLGGPLKALLAAATTVSVVAVAIVIILLLCGVYSGTVAVTVTITALVLEAIYLVVDCL